MTIQTIQGGLIWPHDGDNVNSTGNPTFTAYTIDATDEKIVLYGNLNIVGKATGKTFSSAGATIGFAAGNVTFATSTSTIRIGLQGLSTTLGPPPRSDGTWSVYRDMVQGTDTFSASAWNTIAMASGSATLSHGDPIAIVFDFTTRAGSDALNVNTHGSSASGGGPFGVSQFASSVWASTRRNPNVVITFDDGTLATIDGVFPVSNGNSVGFTNASTPDEYGLVFQVPFSCKADAFWSRDYGVDSAVADGTVTLYSDPLGTPTVMTSVNVYGEQVSASSGGVSARFVPFPVQTLAANTDYWIAIKATSTGTIRPFYVDVANATHRKLWTGGETIALGTRNNGTGAATLTTTRIPAIGVRLCGFDDGAGGSSAVGNATIMIGI